MERVATVAGRATRRPPRRAARDDLTAIVSGGGGGMLRSSESSDMMVEDHNTHSLTGRRRLVELGESKNATGTGLAVLCPGW
jgi:hypothetical protein